MTRGWSEKRHAFTQFYVSEDLDASLLIMPLVFFMAPTDPRMLSSISPILESPRNGRPRQRPSGASLSAADPH